MQPAVFGAQVPLGTVVHRVPPKVEIQESSEVPFTFQQHWVGERDYVSSDEEAADVNEAPTRPNLEVIL